MKVGDKVYDRWWPWEIGTVKAVLKTRIKVQFPKYIIIYDNAHLQFLEKEK